MPLAPPEGVEGVPIPVLEGAAQMEQGLGAINGPAHAGAFAAVLDEMAAGAFDDPGGDGPRPLRVGAARERASSSQGWLRSR